ncbi:hypothetical protein L917_09668 [Phytophthora nicotianae]|uniref:Uncharacterized protein n=1 Tax=Phytophthora nicotianae TaxID=4792 RepID=W2L373_PHYNI|nr:hypothetical protein L917_09668 [Phytophthora nicotianae]
METLFDVLESRLPEQAELKEASLKNDCASTRLFMRQVDAFIKFGLALIPKRRKGYLFEDY